MNTEMEKKMLQAWWEKTGIRLSHHDACAEAFRLGVVVGSGMNYIDAYGRTVDEDGLPIELIEVRTVHDDGLIKLIEARSS